MVFFFLQNKLDMRNVVKYVYLWNNELALDFQDLKHAKSIHEGVNCCGVL